MAETDWQKINQDFKVSIGQVNYSYNYLNETFGRVVLYTNEVRSKVNAKNYKELTDHEIYIELQEKIIILQKKVKSNYENISLVLSDNIDSLPLTKFESSFSELTFTIKILQTNCEQFDETASSLINLSIKYHKNELEYNNFRIAFKNEFEKYTEHLNNIILLTEKIIEKSNIIFQEITDFSSKIKENFEVYFQKRLESEIEHTVEIINKKAQKLISDLENKSLTLNIDIERIDNMHENINKNLTNFSEDLKKIQSNINNAKQDLNHLKERNIEDIQNLINDYKSKFDSKTQRFIDDIETKGEQLKTDHQDFITLVERAGIYELTQNYQKKAEEERKDYKINNWITIGSIAAAIITTVIIIVIPIIEYWKMVPAVNINYFTILARLTISLMFFVLAIYTAKQAAKHYECYQENHRTYLQLAALEPFISRMSDEDKLEIRKVLVPVYFNQNSDDKFSTKGEEVYFPLIADKLIDIVKEKIKKEG